MAEAVAHLRCALESGELHGEVPDGRAFNDPAGKGQACCFCCQSIQKWIQAPATHNVNPFKLPPGKLRHITQNMLIAMRQAIEDETCEGRKGRRILWDGRYALLRK